MSEQPSTQHPAVKNEEVNCCNSGNKRGSGLGILGLILSVVAIVGLFFIYIIYFFRGNSNNSGYIVWTFSNVKPDSGSTNATITPSPNYVYVLDTTVTNVILKTPSNNYKGTEFIIKTKPGLIPTTTMITPPSGVTITKLSIPPGGTFTFIWSSTTSLVVV